MQLKNNYVDYLLLFGTFFIYSISGIFAKFAALQVTIVKTFFFIAIEFIVLVFYALVWQQVLKKFQLTIAMSCKGVTLLYALCWSVFIFHETLTIWNIIGAILVIIGIMVVARDD